jgi:hypothetical protein
LRRKHLHNSVFPTGYYQSENWHFNVYELVDKALITFHRRTSPVSSHSRQSARLYSLK